MWFLVAEFGAFVTFAVVWGAASDALGRRAPLIVAGALGGAASYIALAAVPEFEFGFRAALAVGSSAARSPSAPSRWRSLR